MHQFLLDTLRYHRNLFSIDKAPLDISYTSEVYLIFVKSGLKFSKFALHNLNSTVKLMDRKTMQLFQSKSFVKLMDRKTTQLFWSKSSVKLTDRKTTQLFRLKSSVIIMVRKFYVRLRSKSYENEILRKISTKITA